MILSATPIYEQRNTADRLGFVMQTILSERENEMMAQLSKGYSNKAIAAVMHVSLSTVRTHLRHIYRKLEVESRTEAVVVFARACPEMFLSEFSFGSTNDHACVGRRNNFK